MSSREKNLLTLLLLGGFLMLNFFLFSQYQKKKVLFQTNLDTAKNQLQRAIAIQENSDQLAEEMNWLAENEPAPAASETVPSQLLQFANNQAINSNLTVKLEEILITDTSGTHYHRAQIKMNVTGQEKDLYDWLYAINEPTAFRTAIQIRLSPNTQDETLIDCSAVIAQWFSPENSEL
ncbi:MAG: hypothetical protein V4727_09565 [Verrucomicrobiota bacterium]